MSRAYLYEKWLFTQFFEQTRLIMVDYLFEITPKGFISIQYIL